MEATKSKADNRSDHTHQSSGTGSSQPNNKPYLLYLILIGLGLLLIFMAYEKFEDFVKKERDGVYELKQPRKDQLNDKVKRMRKKAEQYALRATRDGWYECLHCKQGVFYLMKGEVWKYGTTIQGETGRYKPEYLKRMGLFYEVQYVGSMQGALEQELIKIGAYPLLPENLSRPDERKVMAESNKGGDPILRYKLARPPGQLNDQ